MKAKPIHCMGCPMYQDGTGFVPDVIREEAEVIIIGQNPGREEESKGIPFVGDTGELLNKFLAYAGLSKQDVSLSNTIRCRWKGSNDLPPAKVLNEAIDHCRIYDDLCGSKLIIAHGALALRVTTGETSITDHRGNLV